MIDVQAQWWEMIFWEKGTVEEQEDAKKIIE